MTKPVLVEVVQRFASGGLEALVLELAEQLQNEYEIHIVSLEGQAPTLIKAWPRLNQSQVTLHALNKPVGLHGGTVLALRRLCKQLQAEIIHSHHIGPLLYASAATWGMPLRKLHTEHDEWHLQSGKQRRLTQLGFRLGKIAPVADACRVAEALEPLTQRQVPAVIYNGIDMGRFRPGDRDFARDSLGLCAERSQWIGCAARLVPEKGLEHLLQAMVRLPGRVGLAIAGDGPLRESLVRQIHELDLESRVVMCGRLDAIETFYQALDLFCLPSLKEGFPMSLLEAQACGIPVVATRTGATAEAVCPYSGTLVEQGCSEALSDAIAIGLQRAAGQKPRNFIYQRGNAVRMARQYRDLMEAL
ncbi:glycosyltransferase [Ferrimonas pelagia]|uniref:Glycosyltransferase n=1 Tax=Ferrimonas pelagia TaxID=1177826 RepID=A0ABP9FH27_9GAMM